ncbi:putative uncharacterized protein FLJ43944 [Macaca thibetana thibetana]|uniref:putative uncharacterized protein FLJ43944 n=1 Tax=Macaca thibetana thibetana TaxID=257877 RepID=UPI0021BC792E|nr:putative uncharacterized protein FLJ43944 [Macaca thibetana thibetana]
MWIWSLPTVEVEPSPFQQDNPPIPTEQADFSLTQPDPPSPPLDSLERIESPVRQQATAQTSDPSKEVELSPVPQEFPAEPPAPPKEAEPSRKPQVVLQSPLKRAQETTLGVKPTTPLSLLTVLEEPPLLKNLHLWT